MIFNLSGENIRQLVLWHSLKYDIIIYVCSYVLSPICNENVMSFNKITKSNKLKQKYNTCQSLSNANGPRAPTTFCTLKSEGEVTSFSGADKREVRDNREKWEYREKSKYFSNWTTFHIRGALSWHFVCYNVIVIH